jgi:hypothetical protein
MEYMYKHNLCGVCGPIINEKKKSLMPKIKINLYKPLLNVENLSFSLHEHLHVHCLPKLILVGSTIFIFFVL